MGIENILCLDNSVLDRVRGADILNDFMSFPQACEQLWLCAAVPLPSAAGLTNL